MRSLSLVLLALVSWWASSMSWAETTTYVCNYSSYVNEEGLHSVEEGKFVLTFLIDLETGKAYMLGNVGSTEVRMLTSSGGLSFIEITSVGNVMTTAIDTKGKSVHSRNSVMFGDLIPTQYYGKCV